MKILNNILKKLSLTLALIILSSCGSSTDENIIDKKLIMATSADNPPYEFIENGKIVGFDIDFAEEIAKKMGSELIIKNVDFSGLLPAIVSNNIDFSAAGFSMTPERLANVDFTKPYYTSQMSIIFKNDLKIDDFTNLSEKTIGAQFGTNWEEYAKKLVSESENGKVKSLPNNLQLVQELKNGNVDLLIMETMQVEKFKLINDKFESMILPNTKTEFAIALPKGSPLTQEINDIIDQLQEEGILDKLKDKWMK